MKRSDVIVCEVDCDCLLKAFKPIFIYQKEFFTKKEKLKKYKHSFDNISGNINSIGEQFTEDEDELDDFCGEGNKIRWRRKEGSFIHALQRL